MKTGNTVKNSGSTTRKNTQVAVEQKHTVSPPSPFAGKPLDGSQYHDVIEEQQYAEKRPSPEEEKPRYSYLNKQKSPGRGK